MLGCAWGVSLAIGCLGLLSQPALAQESGAYEAGDVGWLTGRNERFRERFQQLLVAVPSRDLPQGWQLATELGRPVAPLLWEMLQAERSNVGRRLVLLAAVALAGGPAEDERVFAWLDRQKSMPEERVLAAMCLAYGPRRLRPVPAFWSRCQGPDRSPEQVLRIAVRLAAARFPGTEVGFVGSVDDDVGLSAACAYAGLPIATSVAARWWNLRSPDRHAELFWRGAMLGGARQATAGHQPDPELAQRARELMALSGDQLANVRAAAALFRLRTADLRLEGSRPDWRLLQVAVAESAGARALRDWLGPVPQPRDEEPARLAVSYVLSRDPGEVVNDRAQWAAVPRIRAHVAVALAWRLLGERAASPIDAELSGVPEWAFVRWASGITVDRDVSLDDAPLQAAVRLLRAERLPRAALRAALEDALWRWGSHPGLGMWEHERLLLRDLLLVGSNTGGGKYAPQVRPEQRYRATGIGPDDVFYDVAVALYDFQSRPRLPIPPEYRLR
ncbi:MAG: hypothetical protein JNM25_06520 [Planctomycetes bacterium]|nr:hypothetical protein [Planctomycetota bacterium]